MAKNDQINKSKTSAIDMEGFILTPLNKKSLRNRLKPDIEDISESDEEESNDITGSQLSLKNPSNMTAHESCVSMRSLDLCNTFSIANNGFKLKEGEPENSLDVSILYDNKGTICDSIESLNVSTSKLKNDSFDLDFSALSLHTPLKRKEINFNFVTPQINIIPATETKYINKSSQCTITPKVNVCKNSRNKTLFKTPIGKSLNVQHSTRKFPGTPLQIVKCSSSKKSMLAGIYENQNKFIPAHIYGNENYNKIIVNNTEYLIMSLLGKGGSSEVYYGFEPCEKLHVAIKVVNLSNPTTASGYINEVKVLSDLQICDRIIKMHDYEIQNDKLVVVMEKGDKDLSTILKELAGGQSCLSGHLLTFFWMDMLYAVKQIHMKGIIHSDLKPANFIFVGRGLKLIDFGIASKVQEDMTSVYKSNQEGSCNYISPEALNVQNNENINSPNYGKQKYQVHLKSDVWSLGCILYQLVYCRTPFQHLNQLWSKLAAIIDPKFKINYPPAPQVSQRYLNTMKRCLQHDIKSRPSIDELINEYEQALQNL
ncbi:dual specificity protein kinase TTK isoform X3 [Sitophilus oryzae]|uniref:Dual specificity protein kinase TTK isoform X3 n=1 Tax=Sitophilus oryzae TaxID=7048 RepID=A0A6J2Y464_SITOR|nr:dual specificity protein kinase TTK isoform X3 [Sitophilus oryzae]XP_030758476.1 dual specificity protein kinase TTK isoform X3 [Sitophilus oryzae]XP_030758477.1 dual specificity protein kinase TTK isoform X3 [Sitophilus oryzae]